MAEEIKKADQSLMEKALPRIQQVQKAQYEELLKTHPDWIEPFGDNDWRIKLTGISEDDKKPRMEWLQSYYGNSVSETVAPEIRDAIADNVYQAVFGDVPSTNKPYLFLVAGTISSGKSFFTEQYLPKLYPNLKLGIINKDAIKEVDPFYTEVHAKYPEDAAVVEDFMLPFRELVANKAIDNGKSTLAEQSLKSSGFTKTCERAIAKTTLDGSPKRPHTVQGEVIIAPFVLTVVRQLDRFLVDKAKDIVKGTDLARYEPLSNLRTTFERAAVNLNIMQGYCKTMNFYNSRKERFERLTKGGPDIFAGHVFTQKAHGPISDIALAEATQTLAFVEANLDIIGHNEDFVNSLNFAKGEVAKIKELQKWYVVPPETLGESQREKDAFFAKKQAKAAQTVEKARNIISGR